MPGIYVGQEQEKDETPGPGDRLQHVPLPRALQRMRARTKDRLPRV